MDFLEKLRKYGVELEVASHDEIFESLSSKEVIIYWIAYEVSNDVTSNSRIMDFKGASGAYGLIDFKKKATQLIFHHEERKFYIDYFILNKQEEFAEIFNGSLGKLFGHTGVFLASSTFDKGLFENMLKDFYKFYVSSSYSFFSDTHFSLINNYISIFHKVKMRVLIEAKDIHEHEYFLIATPLSSQDNKTFPKELSASLRIITAFPPYERWLGSHYYVR